MLMSFASCQQSSQEADVRWQRELKKTEADRKHLHKQHNRCFWGALKTDEHAQMCSSGMSGFKLISMILIRFRFWFDMFISLLMTHNFIFFKPGETANDSSSVIQTWLSVIQDKGFFSCNLVLTFDFYYLTTKYPG